MTNPNLARNLFVASGAAIACLGLTACAGAQIFEQPASTPNTPAVTIQASPSTNKSGEQPLIERVYYPNGTRETKVNNANGSGYSKVISYCDGRDLIDVIVEIDAGYGHGMSGGSVNRTPNSLPCADGRLDPADFAQK